MSVTLDPRSPTYPTTFENRTQSSTALCESKQIPRDLYFPRYKCEDQASALFFEAGLTDETGKIERYLVHLSEIPMSNEERSRVNACLTRLITILNGDIKIRLNAQQLLTDFFTPSTANDILPEIFNQLEIVGSAVNQCLGLSFYKRFAKHLFQFALAGRDEAFIQNLMNKLFTPELENHLNQRFTSKLADLDLRLSTNGSLKNHQALMCTQNACDKLIAIIISRMPILEGDKEIKRRIQLLELLKNRVTILDWNWLTIEDPQFYYHIIKNLAFNKFALISKEGDQFGIVNIGQYNECQVDFVLVNNLTRYEMFPAVRIPCLSQLNPAKAENPLYPTGENWVQAMVDTLTGCVRPDISKATEDDFKMLQCRKTKGEINAVPGSEEALLKIVRAESVNSKNKTVKKILRNVPELLHKPKSNFPYFLAQLIKDAVETHFDNDPMAAIALTINTCEGLHDRISSKEMEIFISEMKNIWEEISSDNHLLSTIAQLFTEKQVLDSHNSIIRKISLIKLCAFLYCQASSKNTNAFFTVYLRKNESKPCLEIVIKGKVRNYSLILDISSPRTLLLDALKYFQVPKGQDILKAIDTAVGFFLSGTTFGGPWSSPMHEDLRFLDHNLDFFVQAATSPLIQQHPLFGMYLLFGTQAQIGEIIPFEPLLINLPLMIGKIRNHKAFVFDHLTDLIKDPVLIQALKKLKNYLEGNKYATEQSLIEKWIFLLSQESSTLPLAKQCFAETLHQLTSISFEDRKHALIKLFHQSLKIEVGFALKLLQYIQEKSYASIKEQLEYLKELLCHQFKDTQDIFRLEKVAESIFQIIKRENLKKEKLAFIPLLSKLVPQSPKAESFIQRLQIPIEDSTKESASLPAEVLIKRADSIASLASQDYVMATENLYDLAGLIFSIPKDKILTIIEKIVAQSLEDGNLVHIQVLLRHQMLHDYFLVEPDNFFSLIMTSIDKIEKSKLKGREDVKTAILERALRAFTNNQKPSLTQETLKRLAAHCTEIFHNDYYLLKPISENYIKTFTQAFNIFFFSLHIKKCHFDCIRLYHSLYLFDRANPIIPKNAYIAADSLEALIDGQEFTAETGKMTQTIIVPIMLNCSDLSKDRARKLLLALFEWTPNLSEKLLYLEHLSGMTTLNDVEILTHLYPLFERLSKVDEWMDAIQVMRFFTGLVPSESFPESRRYLQFIGKLVNGDHWKLACEALAICPFVWDQSSLQEIQDEFASIILQRMRQQEGLSLTELKWVFTLIIKNNLNDATLIASFYEKCEFVMDMSLAGKLKAIFYKQFLKTDRNISGRLEKLIFIVLKTLKFLPASEMELVLNDDGFLKFCSKNASPHMCFEIYKLLWKALLHLIKTSKATDRVQLYKQLDHFFEIWLNGLGILDVTQIQLARLELVEYYLSVHEPDMLTQAVDHFAVCARQMDHSPALKERYKKILQTIFARLIKQSSWDDSIRLTMVVEEIAKSDIPPLAQTKCLDICYVSSAIEAGMHIINNCLSLKTFSREEIPTLKTCKFYNYLLFVIKNIKSSERKSFENILANSRLRLFLTHEELWDLESLLSERYFADADASKGVPELKEKAIDYLCSKFYGIAKIDDKGYFHDTAMMLFDSYFDKKDDTYFNKLIKSLQSTDKTAESLLLFTFEIRKEVYKLFWDNYDESRIVSFIKTINDLLIADLPKKRPISEESLEGLKMWVTLQSASSHLSLANLSRQFVSTLCVILKNYPRDLFEIRMIQSIQLREEFSSYMLEKPGDLDAMLASIINRFIQLKSHHESYYEDYKHLCTLAGNFIFKSEEEKSKRLEVLIKNAFLLIAPLPEKKLESALDEMIQLWIRLVGNDSVLLYRSFLVYVPGHHEIYMSCFRKKLTAILNLALTKKSSLTNQKLFTAAIDSFYGLAVQLSENLADSPSGSKRIDNDKIMIFFREMSDMYLEFYNEALLLDLSNEDKMNACEKYIRIIHTLINSFPKQLAIKDSKFITDIFDNAEFLLNEVPADNGSLRSKCNHLRKNVLPKLKSQLQERCRQFKKC